MSNRFCALLLGMAIVLFGCDRAADEKHGTPQFTGGCDRVLSGDEIRAIRKRGENPMDYCNTPAPAGVRTK